APASALKAALLVLDLLTRARGAGTGDLPGVELLGERAAAAGLSRQAPFSVGGAFRFVRAADGWAGINLARPSDLEVVPALVQGSPHAEPWAAVEAWALTRSADSIAERAQLLGVPAAPLQASHPPGLPVAAHRRGARPPRAAPLVVDLTSLWAGPLCGHLLALTGCRVVKVESTRRPDGARLGAPGLYDLLHCGHESVALDFTDLDDLARLRKLLASADVVLEASRPRALRQLGIEAEHLVAAGATWASITAYGRTGAWSNRVGLGDDVAAAAGLVADREGDPWPAGDALADPLTGVHAAAAVAASLLAGGGFLLDISMYGVAAAAAALTRDSGVAHPHGAGWVVDGVPVSQPRARRPSGTAAELGADTKAVLGELA
nr:CoA transferase [Actinomycetota bacterium]